MFQSLNIAVNNHHTFLMNLSCLIALSPQEDNNHEAWCCCPREHAVIQRSACSEGYLHELTHKHEDESQMARLALETQCRSEQDLDASHHAYFTPCLTAETAVQMFSRVTEKGLCLGKGQNHSRQTPLMAQEDSGLNCNSGVSS